MLIYSAVLVGGYRIGSDRRREDTRRAPVFGERMSRICATAIDLLERSDGPLRATDLRDAAGYGKPKQWGTGPFLDALTWWDCRVYESRPGYVGLNDRHEQEEI